MIPKLIHHIWIQGYDNMPPDDKNNINNIKKLNPDWISIVWNDDNIRSLLYDKYPDILQFYENVINLPGSINYLASKSDIARFVIMYEYGGCYMDVDVECIDGLNSIIPNNNNIDIFACAKKYDMYSSQFFISSPKNKILKDTVESLIYKTDKGNLGGAMTDVILNKYKNDVIVLKDVSMYHCGSSYKCMIPIKINSNDNPLHPRRTMKYICDNRSQFMIAFAVFVFVVFICLISFVIFNRK